MRDITDVSKISVHSLRAGGTTSAANAGIADDFSSDMAVGRARTPRMATLRTISAKASH